MDTEIIHADLVIIGAGPVGMYVARRAAGRMSVLVLDADESSPDGTESRAQLLRRLALGSGSMASPKNSPLDINIEVRGGWVVTDIQRAQRVLVTGHGARIHYRKLVLATGSSPCSPHLDGCRLGHVQTAYSRDDIRAIAASAQRHESIAIIGGGMLAVELSASIAKSAQVTVFVRDRLLRAYAEPAIATRVAHHLRSLGVAVEQGSQIVKILGARCASGVLVAGGWRFSADRVVLACGMRANCEIAREAGLRVEQGILVDDSMQTGDPNVWAVGDCAQRFGAMERGNVALAIGHAEQAVAALFGHVHTRSDQCTATKRRMRMGGIEFVSTGRDARCAEVPSQRITRRWTGRALSITLVKGRIVGYQALLPSPQIERLVQLAESSLVLNLRQRMSLALGVVPAVGTVTDPVVCHCADVSRDFVLETSAAHGGDLEAVRRLTGAGMYCGGCTDALSALVTCKPKPLPWKTAVTAITVFAVAGLTAGLPLANAGESVRALWFETYTMLMTNGMRQVTGYFSLAFIGLALGVIGPRRPPNPTRSRWLHMLYGTLALVVLPLHTLGGVGVGAGLNRVLLDIFLVCVVLGVFVLFKRSLRPVVWLHSTATVVLLAAIAIHVVYIYQY